MIARVTPVSDASEALLVTRTTTAAVFSTTEPHFAEVLDTLPAKTTSKRSTEQWVEMEPLLDSVPDSLPGETDEVEDRGEAAPWEERQGRSRHARVPTTRRATDSEDALQSYLRDMREHGLLLLTPAEEIDLAQRAAAGSDLARRKLVESNLRLVIAIARRYTSTSVPLVDLIQEGNLGLMRAAEKFDSRYGCHFGTYATWWIRQAVSRAAGDQSRLIHLPEHIASRLHKVKRVATQLSQEQGLEPLPEHIAEACNLTLDEVKRLLALIEQPISLDTPVDDETHGSLADTLEDGAAPALAETASQHLLGEELHQALTVLTPRERVVITLRFGIGDGRSRTLLEVGKALGISRERVRQLEVAALMKLRRQYSYPSS